MLHLTKRGHDELQKSVLPIHLLLKSRDKNEHQQRVDILISVYSQIGKRPSR